jgi:hypothetical protein
MTAMDNKKEAAVGSLFFLFSIIFHPVLGCPIAYR